MNDVELSEVEFEELSSELDALGQEDPDLDVFSDDSEGFGELGAEFEEAGLDELELDLADTGEAITLQSLVSDNQDESRVDALFVGGFVKRKVRKYLKRLIRIAKKVRRIRRCRRCIRLLLKTIRCAKTGRWFCALRYAVKTLRCFRKCARRGR